jgi:putative FmdB family regulatory protein
MPIYAFACQACGRFDRLQNCPTPTRPSRPACGAEQVQRQVTAPSFRLAGGGWYETDFKKDGDRSATWPATRLRQLRPPRGGPGARRCSGGQHRLNERRLNVRRFKSRSGASR